MTSPIATPPKSDEIEISLFGPGKGEALVIHIGAGKWVIVDSCVSDPSGSPTPLQYLDSIGVDIKTDVLMIVASHWHDDHTRGLSTIVNKCINATFVCAGAMVKDKFATLGQVYAKSSLKDKSGICEFSRIHSILAERGATVRRAYKNRPLLKRNSSETGLNFNFLLESLSPTDEAEELCIKQISEVISKLEAQRCVPDITPNILSVVLQIVSGSDSILLGSDLENHTEHGWCIVVNDKIRSQSKSLAYKVAHHGSVSGHNDQVWSTMLEDGTIALLAPFCCGRHRIPGAEDIKRIKTLTTNAYITTNHNKSLRSRNFPPDVKRTLGDAGIKITPTLKSKGHIRLRFAPNKPDTRRVDLFNGALKL